MDSTARTTAAAYTVKKTNVYAERKARYLGVQIKKNYKCHCEKRSDEAISYI